MNILKISYENLIIIVQVASNKSSLLLKTILQSTQTLHMLTMNIKTRIIYKSYKNAKQGGLGREV